jgi:uncharacterized tellurite resistance protein B-like protein
MDKTLIEALGKVIIAVAWADGKITREETESLKDLLFEFQHTLTLDFNLGEEIWSDITGSSMESRGHIAGLPSRYQAVFDMYTESPIEAAERERLVDELKAAVASEEDKTLVLTTLKNMAQADGRITDDEQTVLNSIMTEIESVGTGIFSDLGRLLRGAMQRRAEAVSEAPNREKYFEEFLKNKVYYEVRRRLDLREADLQISDEELRKLSMAGGMMARVAQIDQIVLEEERDKIISILQTNWGLNLEAATFVAEAAMAEGAGHFDYLRMSREFLETTEPAERINFLDILFAVANADGRISDEELKEINQIADYLLMRRSRVMEAHSKFNS